MRDVLGWKHYGQRYICSYASLESEGNDILSRTDDFYCREKPKIHWRQSSKSYNFASIF